MLNGKNSSKFCGKNSSKMLNGENSSKFNGKILVKC